jgi:hypothetical protein
MSNSRPALPDSPDAPGLSFERRLPIGWKELIALPQLGIQRLVAKVDTGARTSALHVSAMRPLGGDLWEITLPGKRGAAPKAKVRVIDWVLVKNSGGQEELRPAIRTALILGAQRLEIKLTLTDRAEMRCPMLLGRTTLGARFAVVPEARYLLGEPARGV